MRSVSAYAHAYAHLRLEVVLEREAVRVAHACPLTDHGVGNGATIRIEDVNRQRHFTGQKPDEGLRVRMCAYVCVCVRMCAYGMCTCTCACVYVRITGSPLAPVGYAHRELTCCVDIDVYDASACARMCACALWPHRNCSCACICSCPCICTYQVEVEGGAWMHAPMHMHVPG